MAEPLRLLFCDDRRGALDGFLREVAGELGALGAHVQAQTCSSLEGFRELVRRGEGFDVVASDLNFELVGGGPKDGLLLLAEAHRAFPEADLLLLTAYAGSLTFDEGLELARAGLRPENVFRKAGDDDPRTTWIKLRERIAGLVQAHASRSERTGELLRERSHLRRRDLADTIRWLAGRPLEVSAAAILADPECVAHGLIGRSFVLRERLADMERIAQLQRMALVTGETGTGKELVARALHAASPRRARPFVKSDLAAMSRELVAAELFGHEKGAFTGAVGRKRGVFAEADGGTLFLDEIGNLAPDLQPLLLRVLQDRRFRPVGGERDVEVDVFVVAATNADLEALARDGKFRPDLLERLAVHRLELPPLRERREDVPLLAVVTLAALRRRFQAPGFTRIEAEALDLLAREPWPRNVRQLENSLERLFGQLDATTDPVTAAHVRKVLPPVAVGAAGAAAPAKPLVRRVLDGEERLTLRELAHRHGNDAACEVIEATFRELRGPPDDELAARLFNGMKANTWRQFAFQRGYTWERIRENLMVPFVISLLCLAPPTAAASIPAATSDVVIPLVRFEATLQAEGDAGWTAIEVDGAAGGSAWRRARARFELPDEFEAGDWMLCVGRPDLALAATLNGQALDPVADGCANEPRLRAGPRFVVSSATMRMGANVLDLAFSGAALGRGFERGPAYLLSRAPAALLGKSAALGTPEIEVANFATLVTAPSGDLMVDRILFKLGADGDEPRLAAQLVCTIVDGERGVEVGIGDLEKHRATGYFPTCALQVEDPKMPTLHGMAQISAPSLTTPLRLSDAKVVTFDLNQSSPRQTTEAVWKLRLFPAVGGPLRVVRGKGWILVRNDTVGLFAEEGQLIGSEEAPFGLKIVLNTSHKKAGTFQTIEMVTLRCGIVGFERDGDDPSQAESMEDLVESVLGHDRASKDATTLLAGTLANEPVASAIVAGVPTRRSAVATLAGMRRRGSRFVYAPPAGAQSAEAFWSDTLTLLHFPVHARGTIDWLLSTQQEDGAVRGDLPDDATDAEVAGADAYAVLRACRWYRWGYDGDRFLKLAPGLERALVHADAVDVLAPVDVPPAREHLSSIHLALARIAAHREFAAALEQLGVLPDVAARSTQAAADQLDRLLAPPDRGGRAGDAGFVDLLDEDPREQAIALVYGLLDDARSAALATRLGRTEVGTRPPDWRDVVVARGMLQSGRIKALGKRWDRIDRDVRGCALPWSSAQAAYHGALCFGVLGFRREDYGTVEVRAWLVGREQVRTAVPLAEGPLRVQILPPDVQMLRQVIVANDSSLDLMVVLGIPPGPGGGEHATRGELVHALHDDLVQHGTTWRATLR